MIGIVADTPAPTAGVGITATTMDLVGRHYHLIGFGGSGEVTAVLDRWTRELDAAGLSAVTYPLVGAEDIEGLIAASTVGSRLLIAGPAHEVMDAIAIARDAGVLPCELLVHMTPSEIITIFCPHCGTGTRATTRPGETTECAGCARVLLVRPHTSTHHASYLASVA
ncbi:hypothetical protein I1A62_26275 [Rhodococcus sp. USK10]|uniref:dimethylamine monooxygenase subunit DmmA family protein n=1 Tax=Rhodococcus sp. USK10 TaxID=2789739 RepID=UPI001C5D21E1|nr:dimethylamine monooxygenase subunit DmmA family protein [Rhodococcus sp. USK10]QYB07716.1 hypothetical protein I1A62_26275 [Rhodococcus sp. USK10]